MPPLQQSARIGIIKLRRFRTRRQIIQHKMQQREQGVVLDFHDMLLELPPPDEVFNLLRGEAVPGERRKHHVERRHRPRGDVQNRHGSVGQWRDGRKPSAQRDVVDGDHVDGIVDIRDQSQLDAPFDHAPDEIICIGNCRDLH